MGPPADFSRVGPHGWQERRRQPGAPGRGVSRFSHHAPDACGRPLAAGTRQSELAKTWRERELGLLAIQAFRLSEPISASQEAPTSAFGHRAHFQPRPLVPTKIPVEVALCGVPPLSGHPSECRLLGASICPSLSWELEDSRCWGPGREDSREPLGGLPSLAP